MPRRLLALVLLFVTAATVHGQTPASNVLNEWLTAFNSGDRGKLLTFWKIYGAGVPDEKVSRDKDLYGMTGGFTIVRILEDSGSHLVVSMKDARGGFAEITLELASTEPPQIKNIFGHPVPPPKPERSPAVDDQELVRQIKIHATELVAKDGFSGAVLVARRDKPILRQAWGLADREKKTMNVVDTQFCIGSMNKMFTAIAVLQLVEAGKLSLESVMADYWPDYPNHHLATRVKIRDLLDHTGGTGDIFTPEYEAHRSEMHSLADYVTLFGKRSVAFEPGSKFEYSNYGYILLGRLIEIVSGEDYSSYVQKHIYAAAGMNHTGMSFGVGSLRAVGYTLANGGLQSNASTLPLVGTSAGGGYSTVGDLYLFATALQEGKLLGPSLLNEASSDQSHQGYGFGFNVSKDGGFGHGGGAPGINGEMRILPAGYVVIVLANMDPPSATKMENFIESRLPF